MTIRELTQVGYQQPSLAARIATWIAGGLAGACMAAVAFGGVLWVLV